jgi:hypothetical protein
MVDDEAPRPCEVPRPCVGPQADERATSSAARSASRRPRPSVSRRYRRGCGHVPRPSPKRGASRSTRTGPSARSSEKRSRATQRMRARGPTRIRWRGSTERSCGGERSGTSWNWRRKHHDGGGLRKWGMRSFPRRLDASCGVRSVPLDWSSPNIIFLRTSKL